jgi:hypothetical protein
MSGLGACPISELIKPGALVVATTGRLLFVVGALGYSIY